MRGTRRILVDGLRMVREFALSMGEMPPLDEVRDLMACAEVLES